MKNITSLQKLTLIAAGTLFCLVYVAYILFAPAKVFCEISAKQAFPLQIFYSRGINFTESQSIVIPIKPTQMNFHKGDFPIAEEMAATFLSLPIGPHMPSDDVYRVIDALKKILS